jgi:hypothetical protein
MSFNVTFDDETIDLPYNPDLAASQQFQAYIDSIPHLFPLRYTAVDSKRKIQQLNKLSITTIMTGDYGYLSLHFFDGVKSTWVDSLQLPDKRRRYMAPFVAGHLTAAQTTLPLHVHCQH